MAASFIRRLREVMQTVAMADHALDEARAQCDEEAWVEGFGGRDESLAVQEADRRYREHLAAQQMLVAFVPTS
jgi:Ni,Fe-hydrogenase III large subunit